MKITSGMLLISACSPSNTTVRAALLTVSAQAYVLANSANYAASKQCGWLFRLINVSKSSKDPVVSGAGRTSHFHVCFVQHFPSFYPPPPNKHET